MPKEKDGRSRTSRNNLAGHIPKKISKAGAVGVGISLPAELLEKIDKLRGSNSRSQFIRSVIEQNL